MRWFLAGGALLGIALGCGGLVERPVADTPITTPPVTTPPGETKAPASSAKPATALVLKPAGEDCDLTLLALPSMKETRLGGPVSCSATGVAIDTSGKHALFEGREIDLVTGAATVHPEVPPCANVNYEGIHYDTDGKVVVHQSCGEGEPEWEEGPSYPINHETIYELKDGQWSIRAKITNGGDPEPSADAKVEFYALQRTSGTELRGEDGGDATWVEDEALKAALTAAGGAEPEGGWYVLEGAPRVAYAMVGMGESETPGGPLLVEADGKWVKMPGFEEDSFALTRSGDWLMVGPYDDEDWKIVDLTTRAVAWSGKGTAWWWPEKVALPK